MSNQKQPDNELVYTLNDIMEDRFARYAKYIIQERALPDVRDGLKPVQRRILFAMNELRLTFNSSYKKSARIVGEVIGKYHPHGDTSVYDAMVRLSQSWKVRYPLIDMHGNNGSIDGDPAAAMRYTETRLSEIAGFLLQDLDKETVLFAPNFDDSETEPTILPAMFPNLLINGATGIAAGYATNIPPHNLQEVINATIHRIKNPDSKLNVLPKYIKGPDFPTGGIIQGKTGILDAYRTGRGKIIIRSKIENEDNNIVITEIPYEVVKQDLVKKIDDIKYNEPGLNIKEVRDETDRTGLRIVVELAKQANYDTVRKYLLKNTNLQVSYNFNVVAIANKQPKLLGLKELIDYYITHQKEVITNRSKFELAKAQKRAEIVEGLIKAVSILDEIIAIIRHSKDRTDAINNLCAKFKFTQVQAEAIVQLRLYRLTSTDILQLQKEQQELANLIKNLQAILAEETKLLAVIVEQLELIKNKFPSPRKSVIENDIELIEIEKTETIIEKDVNIWVSRDGYLKALDNSQLAKITADEFNRKPLDLWVANFSANTLDKILLITSKGNYVIIPVYKIKMSKIKDIGEHVNTISELPGEEKIIASYLLDSFNKPNAAIMIATKNGMIKKVPVLDFEATRISKAMKAINLKADDEVVASQLVKDEPYVSIFTKNGFAVKYKQQEIPSLGLRTSGVKSINLKDDEVVGAGYGQKENLVFITDHNMVKKIALKELPVSTRPIKGTRLFKPNKKIEQLIKWGFIINKKETLNILHPNDEIEMFNVDKITLQELEAPLETLGIENIDDIAIPKYYNLKDVPTSETPSTNDNSNSSTKDAVTIKEPTKPKVVSPTKAGTKSTKSKKKQQKRKPSVKAKPPVVSQPSSAVVKQPAEKIANNKTITTQSNSITTQPQADSKINNDVSKSVSTNNDKTSKEGMPVITPATALEVINKKSVVEKKTPVEGKNIKPQQPNKDAGSPTKVDIRQAKTTVELLIEQKQQKVSSGGSTSKITAGEGQPQTHDKVDKNKFKHDLAVEETKELQININDILKNNED
ncbi:DNA topoisomerase IV subunit A [Spiroplasma sp. DGKH1]|uniref:DNA topoisomerase IV subunit A n=1 Tax=Spiroplasma sp. DGKH1 TaxID=3050074 RepID=UPI0034C69C14